jgi:hypothetical protein
MTRYYTRYGTYKHGLVADRVKELFYLFWDHKKKVHNFIEVDYYNKWHKHNDPNYFGTPVVFESPEHEAEFLTYHPDAACMRRYTRYYTSYPCNPVAYDPKDVPVECRRGRWCWKKA